jgi:hypothetical protein
MAQLETDKQRRQRQLDALALGVLAGRHTEWMRWTDWFELTTAARPSGKLGEDTFCQTVKRLLDQGRIRKSQIAKNAFYGVVFTARSSSEVILPHDSVTSASDKAAEALAFLLSKKSSAMV